MADASQVGLVIDEVDFPREADGALVLTGWARARV
jgi:hypothetical protein